MAIKHIITLGYGPVDRVNYIPTLGYGNFTVVPGPFYIDQQGAFIPGGSRQGLFQAGSRVQGLYPAGGLRQGVSQ